MNKLSYLRGLVVCGCVVLNSTGLIGYNDDAGPYFKFGLYHHGGDQPFVIFHDEFRRGFEQTDVWNDKQLE